MYNNIYNKGLEGKDYYETYLIYYSFFWSILSIKSLSSYWFRYYIFYIKNSISYSNNYDDWWTKENYFKNIILNWELKITGKYPLFLQSTLFTLIYLLRPFA